MPVAVTDPRRCIRCREEKALVDFYQKGTTRRGRPRYDCFCKACRAIKTTEYVARNRDKVLAWKRAHYSSGRRRDYAYAKMNSSLVAYDLQFQQQNGRCAICQREPREGEMCFPLDHDHATGYVRGVLCPQCNGGLGCFRDRPDLLRAAVSYLAQWIDQHVGLMPRAANGI